jgi:hypothetical protein
MGIIMAVAETHCNESQLSYTVWDEKELTGCPEWKGGSYTVQAFGMELTDL